VQIDPQQRILLELAWEALEDAGHQPRKLAGSDCGVYVGISNMDYANSRYEDPCSGDAYFMTGGVLSIAANRISYFLDLHGPSMSIDTACSSSLVAVHQACESIAAGECTMSLVGGVNLLLTPYPFIGFSKASMLSATGRCHAFDASADGYVRAEGGAMLVLKSLEAARADGDPIRAIVVASGTNSDGKTSGLSLPSEVAQRKLLQSVYARAALEPGDLRYIEAHGTGTAVGDPIEANAIGHAVAMARDHDDPLLIGSVKTNIGHLEPAAGVAGLLKVVLSLEHDVIPPSLNFRTPNPNIRFDDLNLRVVTKLTPLGDLDRMPAMGVNSFGFGGTNAHVVVRKHRALRARRHAAPRGISVPLILSAQTREGLVDAARAFRQTLDKKENDLYDVCFTAANRRQLFDQRLAVVGDGTDGIAARLEDFVCRKPVRGVVSGEALGRPAKLALLFSGNGAQWQGMGRRLLEQDPVFRDWVGQVDELFRPMSGFSILKELHRPTTGSLFHLTEIAQPALFTVQVGMFESLIAKGLEPGAVFGHSVGEVAAAYASGAYTLEQATRVIYERSRAQAATRGQGKIAAVGMPPAEVLKELSKLDGELEIAGFNSPSSVTVSGPEAQLVALGECVEKRGAMFRLLDLDYPFHSRAMDALRKDLLSTLSGLKSFKTRLPFVSTVTGAVLDSDYLDAEYWWRNVRNPVHMDRAMTTLMADGFQVFMEVSPHSMLQGYVLENLNAAEHAGRAVPTLKRDQDDYLQLMEALFTTHILGCELDVGKLFPVHGEFVRLPHYPWQRESIWFERTSENSGFLTRTADHPLLGYRAPQVEGVWEKEMDLERMPWLGDHVVGGAVVFPAAGFIEMALAASAVAAPDASPAVEYLNISAPLVLSGGVTKRVRLELSADDGRFSIQSRPRLSSDPWTKHVTGRITRASSSAFQDDSRVADEAVDTTRVDAETIYAQAQALGLAYGDAFRNLAYVDCGTENAIARIDGEEKQVGDNGANGYLLHPARLDACFHGVIGLAQAHLGDPSGAAYIPVQAGNIAYAGDGRAFSQARIRLTRVRQRSVTAQFELLDDSRRRVAVLKNVRFRRLQVVQDARQTLPVYENVALRHFRNRLPRAGAMPSLETLTAATHASFAARGSASRPGPSAGRGRPDGEMLAATFAAAALGEMALPGEWITRNQLAAALEVSDAQRPWFNHLLQLLEVSKFVDRDNGRIRFSRIPDFDEARSRWQGLLTEFPAYQAELILAARCGMRLRDLLTGSIEHDDLVGSATLARLRGAVPGFRRREMALRDLLKCLMESWSDPRPLRILELGLDGDPPDVRLKDTPAKGGITHVYARCQRSPCGDASVASEPADESGDALGLAAEDSADPPEPSSFDVVVAPHLMHEFKDPAAALSQMSRMLAPGGLLLIAESPPSPLFDFIRGASPCWWRSAKKNLGVRSSLRDAREWREELLGAGFDSVAAVSEQADGGREGFILFARKGAAASETGLPEETSPRTFLLLAENRGESRQTALALDQILRSRGHSVVHVEDGSRFRRHGADRFTVDPGRAEDFSRVFEILEGEDKACTDVVHLMGLTFASDDDATALLDVQQRRCVSTIRMIQAVFGAEREHALRTWFITGRAGVLDLGGDVATACAPVPSQAPLWGLGRVIANEHADIDCRLVDLCIDGGADRSAELIAEEFRQDDDETEVVLTDEGRYVARMRRAEVEIPSNAPENPAAVDSEHIFELQSSRPGALSQLQWKSAVRRRPASGEVEIAPRATGLNFRDLMFATGLLPEEAIENGYAGSTLGMECAGIVTGVGPEVSEFEVGDEVMGFAPACFSSRIVTGGRTLVKMPQSWSFEEAATVPVAFFTVVYALKYLAHLQRGERVLVHGAAGGVGIAAIQYAQHCGAEIFATAGSEEKRDFLRLAGVRHVFDSRSLDFADEIMARTGEEGVDVVLNSLSGEALARSLSVLRPFGRFLELGKRDFYENTRIGLRPFRENLSYFGIDADQLLIERPETAQQVFAEVMALFDQGVFRPLPYRVFPASRAAEAFRFMQRSEHIGKIVVSHENFSVPVRPEKRTTAAYQLSGDATYLVTGGLSGFGLATARWMVERGARCLVLLGRRGVTTDEAEEGINELEKLGAAVHVLKADVADFEGLKKVFDHIDEMLPPIRGLVHSAMVVDDKLVRNLDEKRMRRVMSPKLLGAWNLHALTRNRELDFFVLYSSATTSFGNPGLGNYVAANVYLESLARLRRFQGLPATAVSWGPISDSGYLARNDAALQALTTFMGSRGLTTRQGFKALELLLQANAVSGAVLEFDWSAVRRALPTAGLRRYQLFNKDMDSEDAGEQLERSAKEILAQLPLEEAKAVIADTVTQIVARIMRLSPDQVDHGASIAELGMDSLMAIEMHMSVNNKLGVNLPIMGLADIPTLAQLVEKIVAHEKPAAAGEEEEAEEAMDESPAARAGSGD
jgi:acyl transferase domain-containing protein/NADPH:quinone reductase-like Zn-dependent oxidoreductase/acyl carrier protein/SAM-dependent methyltransferase